MLVFVIEGSSIARLEKLTSARVSFANIVRVVGGIVSSTNT